MKDERRDKINQLKGSLKQSQDAIADLVKALIKEEDEEKKKEIRKDIAAAKNAMTNTREALVMIKMNKLGSSFFEWMPHKGMNRTMARKIRRQRLG